MFTFGAAAAAADSTGPGAASSISSQLDALAALAAEWTLEEPAFLATLAGGGRVLRGGALTGTIEAEVAGVALTVRSSWRLREATERDVG